MLSHTGALVGERRPFQPTSQANAIVMVDDLDTASAHAIELGAPLADSQPQSNVRVHLDPAGHPFCLYVDTGEET